MQQYADKRFHIILKHTQISNSAQPEKSIQKRSQRNWCFHSLLCPTSGTQAQPTAQRLHMEVHFVCLPLSACSHTSSTESDYPGRLKSKFIHALFCRNKGKKKKKKRTLYWKILHINTESYTTVLWIKKYLYSNQFC